MNQARSAWLTAFVCAHVVACSGQFADRPLGGSTSAVEGQKLTGDTPTSPADPSVPVVPAGGVPLPAAEACADPISILDPASGGYQVSRYQGARGKEEVVAVGVYDAYSGGNHSQGSATIRDTRTEPHVLVVSAYEPTRWTITGGGAITKVYVSGYSNQEVIAPAGVIVVNDSGIGKGFACTYEIPDNKGGCGVSLLDYAEKRIGSPVTYFAGRYLAKDFAIKSCTTATTPAAWQAASFDVSKDTTSTCTGEHYVQFNAQYKKWVGAVLCKADEYKLYLSEAKAGPYYPIADSGGHGQDHCELVNPKMRMTNSDTIDASTCAGCDAVSHASWGWPGDVPVYVRANFGEPFVREQWLKWQDPNGNPISPHITSGSYKCGVSIPAL
jgi:hypothetical protein